jgi:hypothetical protein
VQDEGCVLHNGIFGGVPGDDGIAGALVRPPRERRRRDVQIDDLIRGGSPPPTEPSSVQAPEPTGAERLRGASEDFGAWLRGAVEGLVRDYGLEPVLAGAVVIVVVLGLVVLAVTARFGSGGDPHRRLLKPKKVRRLASKILRNRRLRLPFLVYWPFFGRLVAGVHALILATSGFGKGAAVLLPALAYHVIHWGRGRALRHLIVLDPKSEILEALVRLMNRFGWRYYVYSTLAEHPVSSALNVVSSPARARKVAGALWPSGKGAEDHWNQKARQLFLAACEYLGYSGLWAVYELLRDAEELERAAKRDTGLRRAYLQVQDRERSSILSTATGPLSLLEDPLVRRVFDPDEKTGQPDLRDRKVPCAVFVAVDFEQAEELRNLLTALLEVLYGMALTAGKPTAKDTKRGRGPGVYAYLDEATSFLRIPALMGWLAVGRGSRTYTAVCSQDLSQVMDALGRDKAMSSANNAHIKIFGQTEDPPTMKYAAQVSGPASVRYEPPRPTPSVWSNGQDDRAPRRVETLRRRLVQEDELQDFSWGEFFVRSLGSREVVLMPDREEYWETLHKRTGAKPWSYRPRGVPKEQRVDLAKRLVADPGDEAAWTDPWTPKRVGQVARDVLAKGRRVKTGAGARAGRGAADGGRRRARNAGAQAPENPPTNARESGGSGDLAEDPTYASSWVAGTGFPEEPVLDSPVDNRSSPHSSAAGAKKAECRYCGDPDNDADAEVCKTCGDDLPAG